MGSSQEGASSVAVGQEDLGRSQEMKVEPIRSPSVDAADWDRVFVDLPLFGRHARLRREARRILMSRTFECINLWPDAPSLLRTLSVISPLVQEYGRWPNALFIPEDASDVLVWPFGIDFAETEFGLRLMDYGVDEDVAFSFPGTTYLQYIQAIAASLSANGRSASGTGLDSP